VKEKKSNLHLVGLIGSGSVHSYIDHLYALLDLAQKENLSQKTYLHLFTDGKDSPPHEAAKFVYNIRQRLESLDVGEISTIMGRFYAMDRDNNWDRTEAAYRLLTEGAGEVLEDPVAALEKAYQENSSDERVKPVVIRRADKAANVISDNDAVIFFNFREDSERQLTKAFVQPRFDKFPRRQLNNLYFVAMTEYEKGLPFEVAFPPIGVENALGEVFSNTQKKQVRIAETEKYAHVTYFFNGGKEIAFPGEDRILIPSVTTPHLEQQPAMAAYEITDKLLDALEKKIYDLAVVNYANSDMVGHTGNFDATVKAVEVLDRCLGMIYKWVLANDAILILTSDHGNAEEKFDLLTGETRTEHSTNPVPFYLIAKPYKRTKTSEEIIRSNIEIGGLLADVAPTILELAGLAQPKEMTGKSLLKILI
ncbi:TPA: 2,3-bisphosphoglycerate-independent phosphoglycerate mutase, partial [Candidatus Azambacteria bacterium]|nr:2,3-bisphosphoglycerate-independent phosphoglycerate mutase [Candidatus Azambacteria bacterium]